MEHQDRRAFAGLHVGHPEGYTASDIYSRFMRMKGYKVLHPMGFDSFGLPAENYAIKTGTHPAITTRPHSSELGEGLEGIDLGLAQGPQVGDVRPEGGERLVVLETQRLGRGVARGHDHGWRAEGEQQVVYRRVGQHQAQRGAVRRHMLTQRRLRQPRTEHDWGGQRFERFGRCIVDPRQLPGLLERLGGDTLLYPGHDYLVTNLEFTLDREPGNEAARVMLDRYRDQDPADALVTTLAQEREMNTFFRLDSPSVIARLQEDYPEIGDHPDPRTVFLKLRELRNSW